MKYVKLYENFEHPGTGIFYHGTASKLPFSSFRKGSIGTGFVSSGTKYGGFFFSSSQENAEYYTEYFVCKVRVKNIVDNPTNITNPPVLMKTAFDNRQNYIIPNILDGSVYSDIVIVPSSNIGDIEILEWIFVGDKDDYFESLDSYFNVGEDTYYDEEEGIEYENVIDQSHIESMIKMTGDDIDYLLTIPVFKGYYDSKE